MITTEKLAIYTKYHRDGDALIRWGTDEEKAMLGYQDWRTIEELLQRIHIIKTGHAADSYRQQTEEMIASLVSADAVTLLHEFV